jgi:hypothetical protein
MRHLSRPMPHQQTHRQTANRLVYHLSNKRYSIVLVLIVVEVAIVHELDDELVPHTYLHGIRTNQPNQPPNVTPTIVQRRKTKDIFVVTARRGSFFLTPPAVDPSFLVSLLSSFLLSFCFDSLSLSLSFGLLLSFVRDADRLLSRSSDI